MGSRIRSRGRVYLFVVLLKESRRMRMRRREIGQYVLIRKDNSDRASAIASALASSLLPIKHRSNASAVVFTGSKAWVREDGGLIGPRPQRENVSGVG